MYIQREIEKDLYIYMYIMLGGVANFFQRKNDIKCHKRQKIVPKHGVKIVFYTKQS